MAPSAKDDPEILRAVLDFLHRDIVRQILTDPDTDEDVIAE